ncbi:MAG: transcriptional regulator, partial [Mesorhizobium sp.]
TVAALRPRKRQRPLVAIIGINDATETTDYLMPYGILRRADVADVMMLATQPGPVTLFPVLKVEPDATVAEFDARHPQGADYVIVPAMSRDDDPAVLEWLKRQSAKGAIVIGICAGAKVVGASGLLGLTGWDARHASGAFKFTRPFALTAISNTLAFWDREQLGLELTLGMDEVSLALVADAWSRTYRSRAVTISATTEAVTSRNGMRILPDQVIANWPSEARIAGFEHQPPAVALDQALRNIADRYGTDTTDFVAMQLEYPKQSAAQ